MSFHTFDGRRSPSESLSGSSSPLVLKPATFVSNRPRASSINSNGSNQSNNRSLSIVSLESPRNSIVSIDESLIRPTRNSSTNSLNAMSGNNSSTLTSPGNKATSGSNSINPINLNQQLTTTNASLMRERIFNSSKLKSRNPGAVVLSDEDSEADSKPLVRSRRSSNEKKEVAILKKDYRFKFNENLKIMKSPPSRMDMKLFQDPNPSPLSTSIHDVFAKKPAEHIRMISAPESNKKKSISKATPNPLKNFIFSKDVRFELLANNDGYHAKFLAGPKSQEKEKAKPDMPILSTLKQQNKLLSELNAKWNKTITPKPDDNANDKTHLKRRYASSDDETDYT